MNLAVHWQILEQCFPDLAVQRIRFIGGGSFRVFEVNGQIIFRFPHSPEGGDLLRREHRVCDVLHPHLPLPIPRYRYVSEGCPLFAQPVAGYPKLPGLTLEQCTFGPAALQGIAAQIGEFLGALHGISPDSVQNAGLPENNPQRTRDGQRAFYAEIRQSAFPRLNARERAWTADLFESALADATLWQFASVVVHGDLDSSNILCDPDTERVVGIVDFEEASLGDPAWDFCVLRAEFGPAFVADVLAAYQFAPDDGFERRVAFHARRVLYIELLYGLQTSDERFVAHGLTRLRRAMAGREPIGGWLAVSTAETRST